MTKRIVRMVLAGFSCALAMELPREDQQTDMPLIQLGYAPIVPSEESVEKVLKNDEWCGYCCCCAATMLSMFGCGMHWGAVAVSEAGCSGISTALTGSTFAICSGLFGFGCLFYVGRPHQERGKVTDIPMWQADVIVPPSRMSMEQR